MTLNIKNNKLIKFIRNDIPTMVKCFFFYALCVYMEEPVGYFELVITYTVFRVDERVNQTDLYLSRMVGGEDDI